MNFSANTKYVHMTANTKYIVEQRRLTKLALPIGWLWFTLLAVKTDNLSSKLPTQAHHLHYRASRTIFSDTITSWYAEKQPLYWNWATWPLQS